MNDNSAAQELKMLIEATLLAAGRPLTIAQLLELFDERERPSDELMQEALTSLAGDYENRGIELREVATGWRIQIKAKCVDIVSRLWQERASRYSRALLETLALIAYRQPITRSEIEEIRGVAISSSIMRTIQERNWIRIVGHREVPGRPELLGTTKEFLDYFGLRSLDQLPTLAELRDVENVGVQLELPSAEVAITDANDLVATNDDADASDDGDVIDKVADTQAADDIDADVGDADADTENLDAADELEDGESSDSTTMVAESDESAPPMYAPAPESND